MLLKGLLLITVHSIIKLILTAYFSLPSALTNGISGQCLFTGLDVGGGVLRDPCGRETVLVNGLPIEKVH